MIDIIPAIDLIDGKCVRLSQGDYNSQKVYAENPLNVAKAFEENGIRRLHLVDLDGARSQHIINHKVLEDIATQTSLTIDFGGGIKSEQDLERAFNCGAHMVTVGSVAVTQPALFTTWLQRFGTERIILGADVKNEYIAVNGWLKNSTLKLLPFLEEYHRKGITQVLCTDISRDGMLQGPSVELYRKILNHLPTLQLTASGGVSSTVDLYRLQEAGVLSVVVGKALYENRITLQDINHIMAGKATYKS